VAGTAFNPSNWDGYDAAAFTLAASQTDFTLMVDLSRMSASWNAAVQSDGGCIRITKSDGTTELAYDLIDWAYNAGSPTGLLRVLFSGASGTGSNTIQIWTDYNAGTAVAYDANETYGSDNAYASHWIAYIPMQSTDANDRTANGNNFSLGGGITIGGATGVLGNATTFDGSNDVLTRSSMVVSAEPFTMMIWANDDTVNDYMMVIGNTANPEAHWGLYKAASGGARIAARSAGGGTSESGLSASFIPSSGWYHAAGVFASDSSRTAVIDGVAGTTNTDARTVSPSVSPATHIGNDPRYNSGDYVGDLQDAQFHNVALSESWIAAEVSQFSDNATFWGTWSWTDDSGGGGGTTIRQGLSRIKYGAVQSLHAIEAGAV
jgi:hypothetical protein